MQIDLGDAVLEVGLRVKGCCPRLRTVWHIGPTHDTTAADRTKISPPPYYANTTGKVDVTMDLKADQGTDLSLGFTDEVGNPVPAPADAATVYTVDDPTIIALTDNGDGTARANVTGVIGSATVHAETTFGERTVTGDLLINVIPGDAERVEIVAAPPTEVTPDI